MERLNEKGVSLVEVLAALLLVSIIATAAWTALSIGMKHTTAETSKTEIQQDANIIITKLSAAHRQNETYSLKFEGGQLMIKTPGATGAGDFVRVLDKEYDYTGTVIAGNPDLTAETLIEPKKEHANIHLNLTKNGRNLSIQTTLTRIRTDRP
ncbi:prepilin-type N-terminal cleavage/methylation domain-containing protein [Planococcus sp. SSTMD024]|uniref:prepilin-type N-terminal cleavage/methylation domain-containing protein n=1 Tax=Planococcus sp. SSTMD024 TaxID=3242163 RepID=UPI00351EE7B3